MYPCVGSFLYYHCNTQRHNALLLTMLLFLRIPVMLTLLSSSRNLPSVMILQRPDASKIYACVFPFSWDHKHGEQITDPDQQYIVDNATAHLARDINSGISHPHSTVTVVHLSQYSTCCGPRGWITYTRLYCIANDI